MNKTVFKLIIPLFFIIGLYRPTDVSFSCNAGYLVQYRNETEPRIVQSLSGIDISELELNGEIRYVEPNYCYQKSLIPSDTYLPKQWYLQKIKAKEAWNIRHNAKNITVAVLDSGVEYSHPDLKNNIWRNTQEIPNNGIDDDGNGFIDDVRGWNFVDNNNNPLPSFKGDYNSDVLHGTIVSGVLGAEGNNSQGISGVAWQLRIMPLKVLGDNGSGDAGDVLRAIDYAIQNRADTINLSFVGPSYSRGLDEAIRRAYEAGVIVVAAAGNGQEETQQISLDKRPLYPICMDGPAGENHVIGVAATDAIDQKTYFSSFGRNCIDISAPGISIFSTSIQRPDKKLDNEPLDKSYDGYWSGTSLSAPMVSGTLALIKAVNPSLNRREIIDVLLKSSDPIDNLNPGFIGQLGAGRLNMENAVIDAKTRLNQDENNIIVATAKGGSMIRTFEAGGRLLGQFNAFPSAFKGGINIATGDIDNDMDEEIIAVPASGGGPQVKIFNRRGHLERTFMAYDKKNKGGWSVLVSDVNGDKKKEIILAPISSLEPYVEIYSGEGKKIGRFLAYDKKFRDGIALSSIDIDNDEIQELVTSPLNRNGAVKFFRSNGQLSRQFVPIKNSKQGYRVSSADFSGQAFDRQPSLIISINSTTAKEALIYDRTLVLKQRISLSTQKTPNIRSITANDFNRDGIAELAVSFDKSASIRIYSAYSKLYSAFSVLPKNLANMPINLTYIKQ